MPIRSKITFAVVVISDDVRSKKDGIIGFAGLTKKAFKEQGFTFITILC